MDIQLFRLLRLAESFCRHGGELSACFKVVVGGVTRHGTRVVSYRILRRLPMLQLASVNEYLLLIGLVVMMLGLARLAYGDRPC